MGAYKIDVYITGQEKWQWVGGEVIGVILEEKYIKERRVR